MNPRALRRTVVWVALAVFGCSTGGGSGGCGGCGGAGGGAPIPGGFPVSQRTPNAINAELSADGIKYFQNNLSALIGAISATGLSIGVPCTDVTQNISVPIIGNISVPVYACDVTNDWRCTSADGLDSNRPVNSNGVRTCNAQATIASTTITPATASDGSVNIAVLLKMNLHTGQIPVSVDATICEIHCGISYNADSIPINVLLNLKVDPNWGDILAINVGGIDLAQIIDTNALNIHDNGGGFCSGLCSVLDIGFVKQALFSLVRGTLDGAFSGVIDSLRCQACDTSRWSANGGCPTSTSNSSLISKCDSATKLCYIDKPNHVCAPTELGLQDRVNAGGILASFGGPPEATIDLYAVAGGRLQNGMTTTYVDSAGGVVVGVMGGSDSPTPSSCVPPAPPPSNATPEKLDFPAAAIETGLPPIASYDLGIGVSSIFMNKALYDAYNAGVLCLNVDSSVSSFLSSSLFGTFLPSLGVLTHGETVPMMIALRPQTPPTILIGKGTTKMVNGMVVPDDPLLTISMKRLGLDFYGFIEERYVRLFTLTTDLALPLSLNFDPVAGTVQPALGSLTMLLTNTTAGNSKLLSEDPAVLANLISSVIPLVQPLLGSALGPIALPTFSGLKLGIDGARGAVPVAGASGYQHLALFASLSIPAGHQVARVHTEAHMVSSVVPPLSAVLGPDKLLPYLVVQASGESARSNEFQGYEFAYRIDGGLWSPWIRNDQFEVRSPVLMLQGIHNIEITSQQIDHPETRDPSQISMQFPVDYEPPKVNFRVNQLTQELETVASDVVWHDAITYRYSLDGGAWSSSGPAQKFTLAELANRSSVEVEATDGSGLKATAKYGTTPAELAAQAKAALAQSAGGKSAGGCTQSGVPVAAALLLVWLFVLRRRRA